MTPAQITEAQRLADAHSTGRTQMTTPTMTAALKQAIEALKALSDYVDANECRHESTHRGGAIWTICDDCGHKWSDDRNPFKPYKEPSQITQAIAAITAAEAELSREQPAPMGLTRDRGPYEVTEPTYYLQLLVRAVEAAHGITLAAAPAAQSSTKVPGHE